MKPSLLLIAAAIAVVATINLCLGFYTDTVDYLTFQQPNNVSFQARYWGDEFGWWSETEDGYTIIHNAMDNYWYYAVLGSDGDYAVSPYKVEIDGPTGIPIHLRRTDPAFLKKT
ncbi:MAG TPA: hypothetical protein VF398_04060 [bacterium]|jgi:hypothetical protein